MGFVVCVVVDSVVFDFVELIVFLKDKVVCYKMLLCYLFIEEMFISVYGKIIKKLVCEYLVEVKFL